MNILKVFMGQYRKSSPENYVFEYQHRHDTDQKSISRNRFQDGRERDDDGGRQERNHRAEKRR